MKQMGAAASSFLPLRAGVVAGVLAGVVRDLEASSEGPFSATSSVAGEGLLSPWRRAALLGLGPLRCPPRPRARLPRLLRSPVGSFRVSVVVEADMLRDVDVVGERRFRRGCAGT